MIKSKDDLLKFIAADNQEYLTRSRKEKIVATICRYPDYEIMLFKTCLRRAEYCFNTAAKNKFRFLQALYWERRKNTLGYRLGIEIDINCFDSGLTIYHGGGIVVNPNARIGKNCKLHGGNCIGNNGKTSAVPVLGNNIDLGFGACVIGDVRLSDGIVVGCNAVVVKNCEKPSAVLAGIPARELH